MFAEIELEKDLLKNNGLAYRYCFQRKGGSSNKSHEIEFLFQKFYPYHNNCRILAIPTHLGDWVFFSIIILSLPFKIKCCIEKIWFVPIRTINLSVFQSVMLYTGLFCALSMPLKIPQFSMFACINKEKGNHEGISQSIYAQLQLLHRAYKYTERS